MKQCSKCGIKKSLDNFNKKSSNKDGLYGYCKKCKQVQDQVNAFVKSRRSPEYIYEEARKSAIEAMYG
jgi:hypothetical protein